MAKTKRRVKCVCTCGKLVTTETQKRHMRVRHGETKPAITKLKARLRRLASREAINSRRMSSTRANATPEDPPALPNIPEVGQSRIGWEFEPDDIPDADVDLGTIWAEVFHAHAPVEVEGQTESSLDGTNNAGSFQSINDSERVSESEDEEESEIIIDHAPGGISLESRLQEGFRVEVAKTGK
ncbi:hypothetical protein BDV93DRAFT_506496 [Ceratobasidium sp. AG-I]|nr:hypothetical protein BDV93DRAFT_506496 [Ceratobasidium sp. AG-I]